MKKAKPVARQGRKVTGLKAHTNYSISYILLRFIDSKLDSRTAECGIVKVTEGLAWLFLL
jgi:hypothetical protein